LHRQSAIQVANQRRLLVDSSCAQAESKEVEFSCGSPEV